MIRLWYRPRFNVVSRYTEDVIWSQPAPATTGLLSLHEEHREMLRDGLLDARDVLGGDPVLAGGADEVLHAGAALRPRSLCLAAPEVTFPRSSAKRSDIWTTNTAL